MTLAEVLTEAALRLAVDPAASPADRAAARGYVLGAAALNLDALTVPELDALEHAVGRLTGAVPPGTSLVCARCRDLDDGALADLADVLAAEADRAALEEIARTRAEVARLEADRAALAEAAQTEVPEPLEAVPIDAVGLRLVL